MKFNPFAHSPPVRVWALLALYIVELCASLWLAYEVRFDFMMNAEFQEERLIVLLWFIPVELAFLALFHQFSPLLSYFSTPDLARLFHALFLSSVVAGIVWLITGVGFAPPRGVIVINFVFALVGLTGGRLSLRAFRETYRSARSKGSKEPQRTRHIGIIGAGDAGAVLAHELSLKPGLGLAPVAFFDDDRSKWRSRVHDIPVMGPPERVGEVSRKLGIAEVIIAMPSAPARRVGEIVGLLRNARLKFRTVPSVDQLALGHVKVSQLRNVEVQDLLGREGVQLETEDIRLALEGRVVMVTGAGGSIGSELCRQIGAYRPDRLLLVDQAEPQLFAIEQELISLGHRRRIVPLVADVLDANRMEQIFAAYRPEVIFHAAAHKHVPMMERQPGEAIKNNSLATAQLAEFALEFGVDRFVLISTDKAINPTSVMGATKRLAEQYVQSLQTAVAGGTKFMAVRFGNVLGSSGSVVPIFSRQIAEGGPVKVTHPEMTRYFMTIPEAAMLVLQSATQGTGGEIFVLDMGQPVKIVDLARQMIELSGLKPDVDIQIEFVGMRPGEKLFEELSHKAENVVPTTHPKILRFVSQPADLSTLRQTLHELKSHLGDTDPDRLKLHLKQLVPEYTPCLDAGAGKSGSTAQLSVVRGE